MSTELEKENTGSQPLPSAQPQTPKRQWGKPAGWRKWLYRLAAVILVPALLLLLLEAGLRLFGYGYPASFFIKGIAREGTEAIYIENLDFGRRFFPPGLVRTPMPLALQRVKAKNAYRVFVFGESAAMGYPDYAHSFARSLEVILRQRYPAKQIEVVNTAVTAINSHTVLPIARECAGHEPDLFVILMGNNEVVGMFGAAGVLGAHSPSLRLIRTNLFVKRLRIGQLLGSIMRGLSKAETPTAWEGMKMYRNSRVSASDSRLQSTYENFRQNLSDVCRAGTEAGAKVIVCTVPVNLKDSAPFASLHAEDLSPELTEAWDKIYERSAALEEAGNLADALRGYAEAEEIDGQFADLAFRQARCLLALGKPDQAREKYLQARDLDALRFRSDSSINETIRDVAGTSGRDVYLVDAEKEFAANSPSGLPGENLFLEHAHMNFTGNYVLARAIFRKIDDLQRSPGSEGEGEPAVLTEQECADRLAFTGWNRHTTAVMIRKLFRDPPFSTQLDSAERMRRWDALHEKLAAPPLEELKQIYVIFQKALKETPDDWMIRENFARFLSQTGAEERGLVEFQTVLRQMPHHCYLYKEVGMLQLSGGYLEGAKTCFETALKMEPNPAKTYRFLAKVMAAQGKAEEAIALMRAQADKNPNRAEGLGELADLLLALNRSAEAEECVREAFAIDPEAATAHVILGHLRVWQGKTREGIEHYERALQAQPNFFDELTPLLTKLRKELSPKDRRGEK